VPGIILEFYTQCWFGIISRNPSRERWKTLEKKSRQENTRARSCEPEVSRRFQQNKTEVSNAATERNWNRVVSCADRI
jgi:hypothetical protein